MKNRRNIIESELPPQNPSDIWMKDGKFYRSTKKGWTLIEDQMEFTDSKLMSKSTATSGTIGVNKETGKASIYNDVTKEWSPLGGGMTETTWQELKDKRDAGKLIPGSLYRITDYNCTTTQENTRSAGHQFDIVLLALSENKLAEEGWAMMHDNIYDVTFSDGVTKKCYYNNNNLGTITFVDVDTMLGTDTIGEGEFVVNEDTKTITTDKFASDILNDDAPITYNYFQNSNLSAWKVWYCLDNDKSRFAWADDSVDEDSPAKINDEYTRKPTRDVSGKYAWFNGLDLPIYTDSETPSIGDTTYRRVMSFQPLGTVESYTPGHKGLSKRESVNAAEGVSSDEEMTFYAAKYYTEQGIPESITIDEIIYYLWTNGNGTIIATTSRIPNLNDDVYIAEDPKTVTKNGKITAYQPEHLVYNGRGVIYRLIDEWGNDCPYDFKNIQFVRKLTDGEYDPDNGTDTWVYTFSFNYDGTIVDSSILDSDGNIWAGNNYIYGSDIRDNVFVGGSSSCSVNALSGGNTIINGQGVILYNANELYDYDEDGSRGAVIYINNKKVLTEE